MGLISAIVGYSLSQAYRLADAATVAPFEYIGLPLAIIWGWVIWGELPTAEVWLGAVRVFRERVRQRLLASDRRAIRR